MFDFFQCFLLNTSYLMVFERSFSDHLLMVFSSDYSCGNAYFLFLCSIVLSRKSQPLCLLSSDLITHLYDTLITCVLGVCQECHLAG